MSEREYAAAEHDRRIGNVLLDGVISAVQGNTAQVKIDDAWTTDFLPVFQLHSGARVKSWSAPTIGEQVMVLSPSGEPGAGKVLRGQPSGAMAPPSAAANLHVMFQADDGGADTYDLDAHVRTITIPAGGTLVMAIGATTTARLADGTITLEVGGAQLEIQDGVLSLVSGQLNLGGLGGQPVARVGDPVVNNVISAGSATVRCA